MPYFDYDHIVPRIHEILNTSLKDIATPGTGLTPFINAASAHGTIAGPLVLEIVHIMEMGVCTFDLEEVWQERAHIRHQRRISAIRSATRKRGAQPVQQSVQQALPDYPRK